jgi:redox-sensitive bicupin YhaK (pirin superfamily)
VPRHVALTLSANQALVADVHVRRALPRRVLRRVGPFVFCDHFGPAPAAMNVPAHPHVGLQTVTYLFSGAIEHTDSLGSVQTIRPGDVNWMTAGRSIVHAEQALKDGGPLHGVQTWVALPHAHRAGPPAFAHFEASALPIVQRAGVHVRVIAGKLGLAESPVPTFSPVTLLDVELAAGAELVLPVDGAHELAVYVAEGDVTIGRDGVPAGSLASLDQGGAEIVLGSQGGARAIVLGGEAMPEPTVIWWNFVVESAAQGQALEARWSAGEFPKIGGG